MKTRIRLFNLVDNVISNKSHDYGQSEYMKLGESQFAGLPEKMKINRVLLLPAFTRSAIESLGLKEASPILPTEDYAAPLGEMGVTFLHSIMPIKNLPVLSGLAAESVGETEATSDAEGSLASISLSNLRLSTKQLISRTVVRQGDPAVEEMITDRMVTAIMNQGVSILFGTGARTAKKPQGMGYKITTGALTKRNAENPTFDMLLAMEKQLGDVPAPIQKLAFLTNLNGRILLKKTERQTGSGAAYLMDSQNMVNGYPCFVTNACSKIAGADGAGNLLVFGCFSDLIIAQQGGWMIEVDPFTYAKTNKVSITISGFFDFKGARGSLATSSDESTDADEYAYSFSTRAIK